MKCPCKNCEKREVHCHGKCAEYKEWKVENDQLREKERKDRRGYNAVAYGNRTHW